MIDFPNSPTTGQTFGVYTWDGEKWVATDLGITASNTNPLMNGTVTPGTSKTYARGDHVHPHDLSLSSAACGRLSVVGASPSTSLLFAPFNGDQIKINSLVFSIPAAGIAGLSTTGAFVNGVAGQTLAGTTRYFVYCFNNGGVLTADFCTAGYVASTQAGNVGVRIKSGDNTRTLIGVVITGSDGNFYDTPVYRYTRSWFNRQRVLLNGGKVNALTVTAISTPAQVSAFNFISFAGEPLDVNVSGFTNSNTAGAQHYTFSYLDARNGSIGSDVYGNVVLGAAYAYAPFGFSNNMVTPDDAYHIILMQAQVSGGTGSWWGSIQGSLG